jgi:uncharacterized protein
MEVYAIPFQKGFVIYKPRRRLAFIGNAALVRYVELRGSPAVPEDPEVERFLEAVRFDEPCLPCETVPLCGDGPRPRHAVLLMTNRCNLRCVYCYADAGAAQEPAELDWATARSAIDYALENAQEDGMPPSLTFHGGGEPTMHWDLLVRAVDYARSRDPRTQVSMSSNGIWSSSQREFVCRHFSSVSLSMDGIPAVQNRQRPLAGGGPSHDAVMESIEALDLASVDYGIRMTALEESVDSLPESIAFICQVSKTKTVQIEPTFTSSRGRYADISSQFADLFSQNFMAAWRIGQHLGCQVYYSGARPHAITAMFCQAPIKALVVTADGRLVTCFEISSGTSLAASRFFVGRIRDGRVEYDRAALASFLEEQQRRREECVDCFCYWHCAGDCATRRPVSGQPRDGRCRATRNITLGLLLAFMEEGGGVWQGLVQSGDAASPMPPPASLRDGSEAALEDYGP